MADKGPVFGFEVGKDPKYVAFERHHAMFNGMTQWAGKTTAEWGVLSRAGVTSIVFLTKRGESGYSQGCNYVKPYYAEWLDDLGFIDFRFIESLISVAMSGEKNRQYREAIMDACEGARTLRDVLENANELLTKTKMFWMKGMLKQVIKILSIIIREVERYDFASALELQEGRVNVMDLRGLSKHVQGMIIRAVADDVKSKREDVIVVIPEAQKFVPNGVNSPCKQTVIELIQEGAALGNFVYVDSQAMRNVDTGIRQQTGNVAIGIQKDLNELKRTLQVLKEEEEIELNVADVKKLKLGQFYVSTREGIFLTFAWPAWMPEEMARRCARDPDYVESEEVRELAKKVKEEARRIEEEHEREMTEARAKAPAPLPFASVSQPEVHKGSSKAAEQVKEHYEKAVIPEIEKKWIAKLDEKEQKIIVYEKTINDMENDLELLEAFRKIAPGLMGLESRQRPEVSLPVPDYKAAEPEVPRVQFQPSGGEEDTEDRVRVLLREGLLEKPQTLAQIHILVDKKWKLPVRQRPGAKDAYKVKKKICRTLEIFSRRPYSYFVETQAAKKDEFTWQANPAAVMPEVKR